VVNFALIHSGAFDGLAMPLRGRMPLGLDVFLLGVDDPNIYLSIVLHSTSVFFLSYLVVLAMGIRIVTGITKAKAALIVAFLWSVLVCTALGIAYAAGGNTTIRISL